MHTRTRAILLVTIVTLVGLSGVALADITAGGSGGVPTEPAELEALKESIGAISRERADAQRLEALHATVATYRELAAAQDAGFEPCGACTVHGQYFVNADDIHAGSVDVTEPQLLRYEPLASGEMRLIGVKYVVSVPRWHEAGNDGPPVLFGREFARNDELLGEPTYLLFVAAETFDAVDGFGH